MNQTASYWATDVQNKIRKTLAAAITPGVPVALIDFPDHSNVGDSAIWAGEIKYLRESGAHVRYVCDIHSYNEDCLRRAMPYGQVLLHGGGNFGTVWPVIQFFREAIIDRLTDYKIVQLPQTVYFDDENAFQRAKVRFGKHPDFQLLTRDQKSFQWGERLGVRTAVCPDSALLLFGDFQRSAPTHDILVLARTDIEGSHQALGRLAIRDLSIRSEDWLAEGLSLTRSFTLATKVIERSLVGGSRLFQKVQKQNFRSLSHQRIRRGVNILSAGRVVVTDRLHAHIICTLLGIPHVVLDNNYGKLSSFIECWYPSHPLVTVVSSVEEVESAVLKNLDSLAQS